jgi:hypothetical protein
MVIREESGIPVGLVDAQDVAWERSRWFAHRGEVEPEPVITLNALMAKTAAIPDRIVAIEAVWDGETDGWFVELLAVVERPRRQHRRFDQVLLACLRGEGDIHLLNNQVPPWPEAGEAAQLGQALASSLRVPFYFSNRRPGCGSIAWGSPSKATVAYDHHAPLAEMFVTPLCW